MTKAEVLLTCPPMLGIVDQLPAALERVGWKMHCPKVVQTLSEDELVRLLPQFDGWIIGDDPATRRVFEAGASGKLRAAVKWGVGVDNVDFEAARSAGIPVRNTPGMFGAEVADLAMSYVVALARETVAIDRQVRAGGWPKPRGISLAGKTVGIVGFGDIGRSFARRARAADMRLLVYDPFYEPGGAGEDRIGEISVAPWPDRLGQCDFIVFCCALTEANVHMLDARTLAQAKDGVRIVNVARGPLLDTRALVEALDSGKVHSVALEVAEEEPLPPGAPILRFDRNIFGTHNASNTQEAVLATSEKAIRLLDELLAGPPDRSGPGS